MWLFPEWVRADRGEEALGVVLDQIPADARRLPVRSALDLVRTGLHVRRRATPPPKVWWGVLIADARNRHGLVPERWRPWLVSWLRDPHWRRRYTVTTVLGLLAGICLIWPFLSLFDGDVGGGLVSLAIWSVVLAFLQATRAPQWRWLVSVRNGFVPTDLRPFPADATRVGVVRPIAPNWPARRVAAVVAAYATAVVVANAAVTLGARPTGHGRHPTAMTVAVAVAEVLIVFAVLLGAVRRVVSSNIDRPAPPDEGLMVDRARTRSIRIAWTLTGAVVLLSTSWSAVADGPMGAVLPAGLAVAGWIAVAVIVRRERQVDRRLGVWEVWPAVGPQPFLLVRQDVLDAEGLTGPLARASSPPRNPPARA
jgi:hypothetical protein